MGKVPLAADQKSPWYRGGLAFTCTQCAHCCRIPGYVWLSDAEARAIAAHLGLGRKEFARKYLRRVHGKLSLTEKANDDCIFWDEGCTIYPVRPTQCRTFPFWDITLRSPLAWEKTTEMCPGMNHGRRYEFDEIEALRRGEGETAAARKRRKSAHRAGGGGE
ncbi:MAG: YkgJ family cysteine cluster protein [Planctomycetes bacterium]|nr:YkgJ family cysteine cluster protein [Planctomycetota bacterium]